MCRRVVARAAAEVAESCGLFDLGQFWDAADATPAQLHALERAPGRRRPRL